MDRVGSRQSQERAAYKSGQLKKHSPALLRNWQKRFVQLDQSCLRYYKQENGKNFLQGTINFDFYQCFVTKSSKVGKAHHFTITFRGN